MGFQVTKDHISDGPSNTTAGTEVIGPISLRVGSFVETVRLPALDDELNVLPKVPFKAYDDDGELYFEGWLHDDDECINQVEALRWLANDAGCTRLEVQRDGAWVQEIS